MESKRHATRPPSTRGSTGYVGSDHTACHRVLSPLIRASVLSGASLSILHNVAINNSEGDQVHITDSNITNITNNYIVHTSFVGPDLDALRATLAANKGNTSESAGGSPYASTSSTSDREQSAELEELSVSTDSGMYSFLNLS